MDETRPAPPDALNAPTREIVDAAVAVHKALGPGLLESAYEACLEYELRDRGCHVERQRELPVIYRQVKLDAGYRLDLVVNEAVVLEIKAVDALAPIHTAQLLTYLKMTGMRVGLLLNFNVPVMKDGMRRLVR